MSRAQIAAAGHEVATKVWDTARAARAHIIDNRGQYPAAFRLADGLDRIAWGAVHAACFVSDVLDPRPDEPAGPTAKRIVEVVTALEAARVAFIEAHATTTAADIREAITQECARAGRRVRHRLFGGS